MIKRRFFYFQLVCVASSTLLPIDDVKAWTLFGRPSNFDECMLDTLKNNGTSKNNGNDSTLILGMISASCHELFPSKKVEKKCVDRELTADEKSKLQTEAFVNNTPYLTVNIYNGNQKINIDSVNVRISAPNFNSQEYSLYSSTNISPLRAGDFGIKIMKAPVGKFEWSFTSVKTCE